MQRTLSILALVTFAVVACGPTAAPAALPTPTSTPTPQPTLTPAPTPNIEATVEARLQATLTAIPTPTATPTPAPTPTPPPRLSRAEAQSALVNYLLKEIAEIRIEKEREEIATRVGDFLPTATYEGDGKWVLLGQGRKLNSDGSSEWAEGRWELQETGLVVTPITSEAVTLLEFLLSWRQVLPTPTPFPRSTAEKILFRFISGCVQSLEKEYGAPMPVTYDSKYAGKEGWLVTARSAKINYGEWGVDSASGIARPLDDSARNVQAIIVSVSRSKCRLPAGVPSLLPPTPAPTLLPTPIPFSCRSQKGVTVSEVSGNIGSYGNGLDVSGRLTNTCNEPVTSIPTAVAFRSNGTIILSGEGFHFSGICLNPGQSKVITIGLSRYRDSDPLGSVDIEVEYWKVDSLCR